MKRLIIIVLASLPIGAAAQNRAIENMAQKYADRDGFFTTVVKGDLTQSVSGDLEIEGMDISNIIKDITSIIVVRAEKPDREFAREVSAAVAEGYSTVMSVSSEGQRVRFMLAEDATSSDNEFVIAITGPETNLIVSIVGDYTLGKVTKQKE
jgi:hypothetical protein